MIKIMLIPQAKAIKQIYSNKLEDKLAIQAVVLFLRQLRKALKEVKNNLQKKMGELIQDYLKFLRANFQS